MTHNWVEFCDNDFLTQNLKILNKIYQNKMVNFLIHSELFPPEIWFHIVHFINPYEPHEPCQLTLHPDSIPQRINGTNISMVTHLEPVHITDSS